MMFRGVGHKSSSEETHHWLPDIGWIGVRLVLTAFRISSKGQSVLDSIYDDASVISRDSCCASPLMEDLQLDDGTTQRVPYRTM
jgi:hypothetical protein